MRVDQFDFELPEQLIALRPAVPRHASRLLHISDQLHDYRFDAIATLVRPGDVLVVNNTKVIPAQLTAIRAARPQGGGGDVSVDVTLHKIAAADTQGCVCWSAFIRPAKRVMVGDWLQITPDFRLQVRHRSGAEALLAYHGSLDTFLQNLERTGRPPLPPYIARKRGIDQQDKQDYQTIFARHKGSVAAPTAGLHFTPQILEMLSTQDIQRCDITLHVGAGTFLPVQSEDTKSHKMHTEWGVIRAEQADMLNAVRQKGGRVIAIGTTALRLLESAALPTGEIRPFEGETDIFITPGYRFKCVEGLVTNFHLPRSTLFMLVCAFAGMDRMKKAYQHAIEAGYRFYSYGDACYLERHD